MRLTLTESVHPQRAGRRPIPGKLGGCRYRGEQSGFSVVYVFGDATRSRACRETLRSRPPRHTGVGVPRPFSTSRDPGRFQTDADQGLSIDEPCCRAARGRTRALRNLLRRVSRLLVEPFVLLRPVREEGRIVDFVYGYAVTAPEGLIATRTLARLAQVPPVGLFDAYVTVVETDKPLELDDFANRGRGASGQRLFDARALEAGELLVLRWQDATERDRRDAPTHGPRHDRALIR